MQIAYVAWKQLDPAVRERADALLRLNPDYEKWTAGVPQDKKKLYAFIHAATWPDDIRMEEGYLDDSPNDPAARKITGYGDRNRHAYWHFRNTGFSPDREPFLQPELVDAVSQLNLMIEALPASSTASDDVRSYSLVWVLHLTGDLHQPLHAVTRLTRQLPDGDAGGNAETVIPASGETIALHAYWDRIFGGYSSAAGAVHDADQTGGLAHFKVNKTAALIRDPQMWAQESTNLAREFAYAPPVSTGANAVYLTREYETNARNIAISQAALAAARLARVLNAALK
jgi:hypothetical protein